MHARKTDCVYRCSLTRAFILLRVLVHGCQIKVTSRAFFIYWENKANILSRTSDTTMVPNFCVDKVNSRCVLVQQIRLCGTPKNGKILQQLVFHQFHSTDPKFTSVQFQIDSSSKTAQNVLHLKQLNQAPITSFISLHRPHRSNRFNSSVMSAASTYWPLKGLLTL